MAMIVGAGCLALRGKRFGAMTDYEGQTAPHPPEQTQLAEVELVQLSASVAYAFADFSLDALVLSAKRYGDSDSDDIPVDLALGWGVCSDPSEMSLVDVKQRDRWYFFRTRGPSVRDVYVSSANVHVVPRTVSVRSAVLRIRRGDVVHLSGKLCDVERTDGSVLRSSRTREDTGGGACEVFLVEQVGIIAEA